MIVYGSKGRQSEGTNTPSDAAYMYFLSLSTESTKERPSREVPSLENLSCQHRGILWMPKGVPTLSYTRHPASSPGQGGARGSLVASKHRPTWSNSREKSNRGLCFWLYLTVLGDARGTRSVPLASKPISQGVGVAGEKLRRLRWFSPASMQICVSKSSYCKQSFIRWYHIS